MFCALQLKMTDFERNNDNNEIPDMESKVLNQNLDK